MTTGEWSFDDPDEANLDEDAPKPGSVAAWRTQVNAILEQAGSAPP